jgi:hyperosmotically inducible protein
MGKQSGSFWGVATLAATSALAVACSKTPDAVTPAVTSVLEVPAPAAGPNVADRDVTEHVKTALQQDDMLKGFDITVITIKGDVRLIGVLDRQAQIDEAIRIARAADGAHTVHDELTLKP